MKINWLRTPTNVTNLVFCTNFWALINAIENTYVSIKSLSEFIFFCFRLYIVFFITVNDQKNNQQMLQSSDSYL